VVSGEAYLAHDLQCSGTGIVVDGLPSAVNLDGHTLAGDGTGTAVVLRGSTGESSWLQLDGGRITGWDVAVGHHEVGGATFAPSLRSLEVDHVGTVLETGVSMSWSISSSTLRDNDVVVDVAAGSSVSFEETLVERNRRVVAPSPGSAYGFARSDLRDNTELVGAGEGAHVRLQSVDVRGSATVVGAGWASLGVVESRLVDNGVVVDAGAGGGTVRDNLFERNRLAVTAAPWTGAAGDGALVVTGNRFRHDVDAIRTPEGADVHLGDNLVHGSTGWGIHAPGATDLGGNRAAGNGNEPQCVGVVCTEAEPAPQLPPDGGPVPVTRCGQLVDDDAYLAQDLQCAGQGIVVAHAGTLDLAGHTLAGDGTGTAVSFRAHDRPGRPSDDDTLVVRGGWITGWAVGTGPDDPSAGCVGAGGRFGLEELVVEQTAKVVCKDELLSVDVTDSTFRDNDVVFAGGPNTRVTLARSHVEGTRLVAANVADATSYTFSDSTFVDNEDFADGGAMSVMEMVSSYVEGSREVVGAYDWHGFTLRGNTFVGNGLVVDGANSGGTVVDNVFEGNRLGVTARLPGGDWWDGPLRVTGNTFRGNVDAIDTPDGADVHLGDNVVHDSTGWGIRAPGATDLGGNRAWGNGNEPQCLGVVCAGAPG